MARTKAYTGPANCVYVVLESGKCVYCSSGYYVDATGQCASGNCSGATYNYQTRCFDHCPLFFYKSQGNNCLLSCTSHATDINTFGDTCVLGCPHISVLVGNKCECPVGTIPHENGTCVASCPVYYWPHYNMCIDTLRTDPTNNAYSTTSTHIYCPENRPMDFITKKCLNSCVLPNLVATLPIYGHTCISPADCTAVGLIIDEKYNKCLSSCIDNDFFDFLDNKCLYTCPTNKLFPNQETHCDERCGVCENCHPTYFKNSTLACQKECPKEEIWIAPNSCTTCKSECYTCLNVTQNCDTYYYPYQLM